MGTQESKRQGLANHISEKFKELRNDQYPGTLTINNKRKKEWFESSDNMKLLFDKLRVSPYYHTSLNKFAENIIKQGFVLMNK